MSQSAASAGPREGSPAFKAVEVIRARGRPVEEGELSDALDMNRIELGQKLAFPVREGLLRCNVLGTKRYYALGANGKAQAEPAEIPKTEGMPPEPLAIAPPRRTVCRIPAKDSSEADIVVPRFLDGGLAADLVDVVQEAAAQGGIDIDRVHRRQPSVTHARELIATVLPLLEVAQFEVARYSDGRVLLEIDGVSCILPATLAEKAVTFFSGKA